MPEEPLELQEVFDPGKRIDRWIFLLSETVADLGTMESRLKQNLFGKGTSVAHSFYLQRHLAARLIDSWRAVAAIRNHAEIRQFVTDAEATAEADYLLQMLTKKPGDKSETPFEQIFREERHRTVHLASVDDDKLRETMEAAEDEVVQIGIFEADQKMVIEFPEAALTHAVYGNPAKGVTVMEERAELMEEVLRQFGVLWGKCLTLHLARQGVPDPRRLHVVRQKPKLRQRIRRFLNRR